jgi:lipopolysaccharide biosynthesis glycosyltransferase
MILNVAYSCNEAYIPQTGVSILSLLENNKNFEGINIYFISKSVSRDSLIRLSNLISMYNRNFICIDFDELCSELNIISTGRHIETVYSKLFFEDIPKIDRILYLDSDTIVNDTLFDFYNIDIENYLIAGVSTFTTDAKTQLNLTKSDEFINDGIVLMNLKKLREFNAKDKFLKCIQDFEGSPPVLSEGVINKVCRGKIKRIHPKYNFMSGFIGYKHDKNVNFDTYYPKYTLEEALNKPVIIHFLSAFFNRPWDVNCTHPLKNKYLYFKNISEWKNVPLTNKKLDKRIKLIGILYKYLPGVFFHKLRSILK